MGSGFRRKGLRDRKGFWNGLAAAFAVALVLVLPANQLLAQSSKITPVVEFFSVENYFGVHNILHERTRRRHHHLHAHHIGRGKKRH